MKTTKANTEEKKCTLYDMILIAESVKTPWDDLTEEQQKLWSPYVVNRFLSSREEYVPLIALIDKYSLTPERHYGFVCSIVNPNRKHYFDYKAYKTKKSDEEDKLLTWACCREYEIGNKEAKSYISQMSSEVKCGLKSKWKDSFESSGR